MMSEPHICVFVFREVFVRRPQTSIGSRLRYAYLPAGDGLIPPENRAPVSGGRRVSPMWKSSLALRTHLRHSCSIEILAARCACADGFLPEERVIPKYRLGWPGALLRRFTVEGTPQQPLIFIIQQRRYAVRPCLRFLVEARLDFILIDTAIRLLVKWRW